MKTIYTAIALFGITTILGIYLSSLVLRGRPSSKIIIIVHGICSVFGFSVLLLHYPYSAKSIFYFAIATCCGLVLLYQDITRHKFTKWLCYAHAILTIIGLMYLFQLRPK